MRIARSAEGPTESGQGSAPFSVERAIPDLYRYAVRLTGGDRALAEDLVQETCLAYVANARTGAAAETNIGWLMVVLRRRFLDSLRRTNRENARIAKAEAVQRPSTTEWSTVEDNDALLALGRLAPDHRAALVFRYVDDLTVRDVANLIDRSMAATESLLARARRELARHLEELRHG